MFNRSQQHGQGMTEYIIIVALIAIAAIAAFSYFGQTVRLQTGAMAQEVAGQSAEGAISNAQTAASAAVTSGNTKKGLADYGKENPHGTGSSGSTSPTN